MKFAICNELFEGWEWAKVCEFAASLGYAGIEVAPFTLAPSASQVSVGRRAELREVAARNGLEILGLHWLLAKTEGFHIAHPDERVRRRTADYLVELIRLCSDLGGKLMVFGSPKQRSLLPGMSRAQAMELAAGTFSLCMDEAAKHGVTIAMEPLSPAETDFIQTAAEGIELIERVNHPAFKLHLDVKAMSSEKKPIAQIIRESARHTVHFHANDPNLLGPGMGTVKFGPIIAALREVGYEGWLSVEVFDFAPGAENIARQSIAYLRQVAG
jgi:sugar phosphate isomerase/epimerase